MKELKSIYGLNKLPDSALISTLKEEVKVLTSKVKMLQNQNNQLRQTNAKKAPSKELLKRLNTQLYNKNQKNEHLLNVTVKQNKEIKALMNDLMTLKKLTRQHL